MSKKPSINPLLGPGVSNFKLEDSFGVQPTLIVPQTASSEPPKSAALFSDSVTNVSSDPFSEVNLNSSSPIKPSESLGSNISVAPPPVMSLG